MDMLPLPTEIDLHKWLRNHYYPDLRLVGNQYSGYDAWSAEFKIQVELKIRSKHYEDLLLEKLKYDKLLRLSEMNNLRPVYICATPQGVWEYNLRTITPKWEIRDDMPKSTYWPQDAPIAKTVALLPISQAKQLGERQRNLIYGYR